MYRYLFLVLVIVTISTFPPIGGFIFDTSTVALSTKGNSFKILKSIRSAACSKSLERIAISSLTCLLYTSDAADD